MSDESSAPRPQGRWVRTRLAQRAGRYAARMGPTKQLARAVDLSDRRIRQIRDGSCPGVPQRTLEWIDRTAADPRTNPYPLVTMILERIHEQRAAAGTGRPWEELCDAETRQQGKVDLLQLRIRGVHNRLALEEFCELATDKVTILLEMVGAARAKIARGDVS